MKVLGRDSLSSIISIFLTILLIICIGILIGGAIFIANNWTGLTESNLNIILCGVYISGILSLIMIIEFLGIFKMLKNEKVFEMDNAKRLKVSYIISLIIGVLYSIISIMLFNVRFGNMEILSYVLGFFSIIISMVFLVFGIGLVVLTEIYKKAIIYKEENELTI